MYFKNTILYFEVFFRLLSCIGVSFKRQFSLVAVLGLAAALVEVATLAAFGPFISVIVDPAEAKDRFGGYFEIQRISEYDLQEIVILSFIGMVIFNGLIKYLYLWFSSGFIYRFGTAATTEVYEAILHLPFLSYKSKTSGEMISSVISRSSAIVDYSNSVVTIFTSMTMLIFAILTIFFTQTTEVLSALVVLALCYGLSFWLSRTKLKGNGELSNKLVDSVQNSLIDSINGIKNIIIDQRASECITDFSEKVGQLRNVQRSNLIIMSYPRIFIEAAGLSLIGFVTLFLVGAGDDQVIVSLSYLAVLSIRILPMLQQIYSSYSHMTAHYKMVSSALSVLTADRRVTPLTIDEGFVDETFSSISFDNVSFSYPGVSERILNNVSFDIEKGDVVGIVGETGSGKSTLLDLCLGLLTPTSGKIYVNGRHLEDHLYGSWHRKISHVPQSPTLLAGSLYANITHENSRLVDKEPRVHELVKIAQLQGLTSGTLSVFDFEINQDGKNLSGGQRQRVSIARALYKNADVYFLDEATNALDEITEAAVITSLLQYLKDKTLIMITHNPKNLAYCNKVIEISPGKVKISAKDNK